MLEPIPATLPKGDLIIRKRQPGRTLQVWTVLHDPRGLFRAGKAQFGSLDIHAMIREGVFTPGTLLQDLTGQQWRVEGKAKVKI